MSLIHSLTNRWEHSGFLTRTAAVIYLAPVAIWGVCTVESMLRCALRALHTGVSLNAESRSYRWKETQIHGMNAYGTSLLTLVSPIPILGTVKSYAAIFKMISNHVSNTWELRALQQRAHAHAADTLYQELNAWEPDIEKLISLAVKMVAPTPTEIEQTADKLQASLIGRSWSYTGLFHFIDGSCRAVRIIVIRVGRFVSALFSGRLLRAIIRGVEVIKNGVKQEVQYTCNLVNQPNRANVSTKTLPEIYFDIVYMILEKCDSDESREKARLLLACHSIFREYAISNALARRRTDGPLPEEAPDNYFHALRELPAACAHYSKLKARGEDLNLQSILRYFETILPYIDRLDSNWTPRTTSVARMNLFWTLSKRLPNLREITLDMSGIDPRWQMLIAVQFAKYSPWTTKSQSHWRR